MRVWCCRHLGPCSDGAGLATYPAGTAARNPAALLAARSHAMAACPTVPLSHSSHSRRQGAQEGCCAAAARHGGGPAGGAVAERRLCRDGGGLYRCGAAPGGGDRCLDRRLPATPGPAGCRQLPGRHTHLLHRLWPPAARTHSRAHRCAPRAARRPRRRGPFLRTAPLPAQGWTPATLPTNSRRSALPCEAGLLSAGRSSRLLPWWSCRVLTFAQEEGAG